MMEKVLMTTKEAAKYLGTTPDEVRRLHSEGLLRRAKGFKSPFRFSRYHLEEFLKDGVKLKA